MPGPSTPKPEPSAPLSSKGRAGITSAKRRHERKPNKNPKVSVDGLTWQPARRFSSDEVVVLVDVAKFDRSWSRDALYIGPGGAGGIDTRYTDFQHFLAETDIPVEMPEVGLTDRGELAFDNGRHRFSVLRDHGHRIVPVAVRRRDAAAIQERFGASSQMITAAVTGGRDLRLATGAPDLPAPVVRSAKRLRIDRLLERQGKSLDRLDDADIRRLRRVYRNARRQLRERLATLVAAGRADSWSAEQTRAAAAQVEAGILRMEQRLGVEMDGMVQARQQMALNHMLQLLRTAESSFDRQASSAIQVEVLNELSRDQGLLLHRYSIRRYSLQVIERIQAEMARGIAMNLAPSQIITMMAGPGGAMAGMEGRVELILRMETARAYDVAYQKSMVAAAAETDDDNPGDPLMKRADEFRDNRTHPLSLALDGRLAPLDGVWRVPAAEVRAWAAATGRRTGGIVWQRDGSDYVGAIYPAHFNDRGRSTAWRRSWGTSEPRTPPRRA